MKSETKEYMNAVIKVLIKKYQMSEIAAYKLVKESFLYESLRLYPEQTLHDDIETNADIIYHDKDSAELLRM